MHYGEFANYAERFAGALTDGTPHQPDLGLRTSCVIEALRRSARDGGVVEVAPLLAEIGSCMRPSLPLEWHFSRHARR